MTIYERIKQMVRQAKCMSIPALEEELGFSNGSLAKSKDIPSSRIVKIAEYLDVSTDLLLTGTEKTYDTPEYNDDEVELVTLFCALKKEQQTAILEILRSIAPND